MTNTKSRCWRFIHNAIVHPALELLPESIGDIVHDATAKLAFRVPQETRVKVAKKNYQCAYCRKCEAGEPRYSIHRDGFGIGPEVPLCSGCGAHPTPTAEDIWERISKAEVGK